MQRAMKTPAFWCMEMTIRSTCWTKTPTPRATSDSMIKKGGKCLWQLDFKWKGVFASIAFHLSLGMPTNWAKTASFLSQSTKTSLLMMMRLILEKVPMPLLTIMLRTMTTWGSSSIKWIKLMEQRTQASMNRWPRNLCKRSTKVQKFDLIKRKNADMLRKHTHTPDCRFEI